MAKVPGFLVIFYCGCVFSADIKQKPKEVGGYKFGSTNGDDITIDDNWLNTVLKPNINETNKQYNQIIIDQEPKHVQLPPLITDDEDHIEGSGSGDEKEDHKTFKISGDLSSGRLSTPETTKLEKQTLSPTPSDQHEEKKISLLPEPKSEMKLFEVEEAAPPEAVPPTASSKDNTSPETRNDDVFDDGDDLIKARFESGSGESDIVSDDEEEMLKPTNTKEKDPKGDKNCGGISCNYGATCLVQNGVKSGCVCGMKCENFKGNPVCGSDGMLYENICHLQLESCSLQVNITLDASNKCLEEDTSAQPFQQCKTSYPYWTPWSLWIQSGDKEFRFRYCKRSGPHSLAGDSCNDPQIQVRECTRKETSTCKSLNGKTSQEYEYTCGGVDLAEISSIDEIFPHLHDEDESCEFSLYDIGIGRFVHRKWTMDDLEIKGDKVIWCHSQDRFVSFYDSTKKCSYVLDRFCRQSEKCSQKKKEKLKSRGNFRHNCWKKFLLGNKLPRGFPGMEDKYFLCQRFARDETDSIVATRRAFYGTVYDTGNRTPFMSFGRFKNLSDTSKPIMDFMIERGLIQTKRYKGVVSKVYDWLNGAERRGMSIDDGETQICDRGRYQALNSDYETREYKPQQLLPYMLTGNDVREKIATYTLTNTAPIHASLYNKWETALLSVRKYAQEKCGIPVLLNPVRRQRSRVSRDHPEMYVVSGVVSLDKDKIVGNEVIVPYLFWFAGCCIKGADTASYALYARNVPDGIVISAPVAQLEILLSDIYNSTSDDTIKIFPAYDDICGSIKSDISGQIRL